ncbi:diaminobutyrate aminotransferase [Amycolatopsis echigonensis]|uniref:Diaminobutyrate--2-oxoglutarate transaminase n=1 Tax=Amycolatopsis echigonensis TaxID=2576905 RepID=A0A2N3WR31_9PSEU|nr:aminotransferase class III-fold pyridoxal phosphate-dependent enzyme [Amycolatopsis niigatensis]PKV96334.1 diaminobutyrate aminotransferase [Amycolatopsis niigatensis]
MTILAHPAPLTGPAVHCDLPGPRSAEYLARQDRREPNARGGPRRLPIAITEGSGSFVRDADGNVFIDFLAGAGVLSLGHNHPELVAAMTAQLSKLTHALDFATPVKDEFSEAQFAMLPEALRSRMKLHFCGPAGTNAVEAALKLCKTATGRGGVVSFQGRFHRSAHAALGLTGPAGRRPRPGALPGTQYPPYSSCPRCPAGPDADTCAATCPDLIERSLHESGDGLPLPAAVLLELVQGEGGVVPARADFVHRVRELTRELGIPLIVDELRTGCGRTGTWFAFERYGIEPDVIVASKALSGIGSPVSLIIYDERLDNWAPRAHGTPLGNQLAFAAGARAIEVVNRDSVLDNVVERGHQFEELLSPLASHPWVTDVRGTGLMWGIELADPRTGAPASELALAVRNHALRRGLIVEVGGRGDSVVRLLPPLNVTADVVRTAAGILLAALDTATREAR